MSTSSVVSKASFEVMADGVFGPKGLREEEFYECSNASIHDTRNGSGLLVLGGRIQDVCVCKHISEYVNVFNASFGAKTRVPEGIWFFPSEENLADLVDRAGHRHGLKSQMMFLYCFAVKANCIAAQVRLNSNEGSLSEALWVWFFKVKALDQPDHPKWDTAELILDEVVCAYVRRMELLGGCESVVVSQSDEIKYAPKVVDTVVVDERWDSYLAKCKSEADEYNRKSVIKHNAINKAKNEGTYVEGMFDEFVAQSGKIVSEEHEGKWEKEEMPYEPNIVGKFFTKMKGKLTGKLAGLFSGWWDSVSQYVSIAKEYASLKMASFVESSMLKTLKKLWGQAYNFIVAATVSALAVIAWKYRHKISKFVENILGYFTEALDAFGGLFEGFGGWLRGMYDYMFSSPGGGSVVADSNGETTMGAQSGLTAVAATVGAVAGFMAEKNDHSFKVTFKNLQVIAKTVVPLVAATKILSEGLQGLFDWLPNILQDVLYRLFGLTGNSASRGLAGLITRAEEVIKAYTTRVDGCDVLDGKPILDVGVDTELAREVVTVYSGLTICLGQDMAHGNSKAVVQYVMHLLKVMQTMVERAQCVLGTGNTRPEPVGLYIFGASGVGKSSVVQCLASAVFPTARPEELYYSKNVSEAFNSKYAQQLFFLIDDYGTATGPGSDTPSQDMLRYISGTAAYMNMAAIHEKGKQFASKVVVITTNKAPESVVSGVANPDAFHARFIHLQAYVPSDYALPSGKLDPSKATLDMDHIRFRVWHQVSKKGSTGSVFVDSKVDLSFMDLAKYTRGAVADAEIRYGQKKEAESMIRAKLKDVDMSIEECVEVFRKVKTGMGHDEYAKVSASKNYDRFLKEVSNSPGGLPQVAKSGGGKQKQMVNDSCAAQGGFSTTPPQSYKTALKPPVLDLSSSSSSSSSSGAVSVYSSSKVAKPEYVCGWPVKEVDSFINNAINIDCKEGVLVGRRIANGDSVWRKGPEPPSGKKCFVCNSKDHYMYYCSRYFKQLGKANWDIADKYMFETRGLTTESTDQSYRVFLIKAFCIMVDLETLKKVVVDKQDQLVWRNQALSFLKSCCIDCLSAPRLKSGFCFNCEERFMTKEQKQEKARIIAHQDDNKEDFDMANAMHDEVEFPCLVSQCGLCDDEPDKDFCSTHGCEECGVYAKLPGLDYCVVHMCKDSTVASAVDHGAPVTDLSELLATAQKLGEKSLVESIKKRMAKTSNMPDEFRNACRNLRLYAHFPEYVNLFVNSKSGSVRSQIEDMVAVVNKKSYWIGMLERIESRSYVACLRDFVQKHKVYSKIFYSISAFALGFSVLRGVQYLVQSFGKKEEKEPEIVETVREQSWDPKELAHGRFVRSTHADWKNREAQVELALKGNARDHFRTQAGSLNDEIEVFRRSMVHIRYGDRFVWGLGVKGSLVLCPLHIFMEGDELLKDNVELRVGEFNMSFSTAFKKSSLTVMESAGMHTDLCLYDFGLVMQSKRDLTGRFLFNDELLKLEVAEVYFVSRDSCDKMLVSMKKCREEYKYEDKVSQFYLAQSWMYEPKTDGDCGKLLVAKLQGKFCVVGFHIASRRSKGLYTSGVGCVLTKEIVAASMEVQDALVVSQSGVELGNGYVAPEKVVVDNKLVAPKSDLRVIGRLPGGGYMDGRFQWRGLPYLDEEWHTKQFFPAVTGTRHPLVRGVPPKEIFRMVCERVHHSTETKLFPQDVLEMAGADVFDVISSIKPEREVRAMTMDEMVDGRGGMAPMNMNSSEGKFYNERRPSGAAGKRWMFSEADLKGHRVVTDPELIKNLEEQDAMLRVGEVPPYLWTMILKVEQRDVAKVMAVKTRGVIGSPVDYTMLCRKYFGAFLDHVFSNPLKFGVAVGMNVYSTDWDDMISKCLSISKKGLDGDYGFYERYVNAQVVSVLLEGIEAFYARWTVGEVPIGDKYARRCLCYVMLHAMILVGDMVLLMWCMMPSGDYKTTLFNSVSNQILFRMSYVLCVREMKPSLATMDHYNKLCVAYSFGDDLLAAISEILEGVFGTYEMCQKLKEYGVTFTGGDKTEPVVGMGLKSILDCEFLKHTTKVRKNVVPGMVYFPIALDDSLMKTLSYSHSTLGMIEATVTNGNDVLSRVWSSGKERFTLWRERVWSVWRRLGIQEVPLSYRDVEVRWINGDLLSYTMCDYGGAVNYAWMSCVKNTDEGAKWIAQSGKEETMPSLVPTEETPIVSLGDAGADTKTDGYVESIPSIGTLIKRSFPCMTIVRDVSEFYVPTGGVLSARFSDAQWDYYDAGVTNRAKSAGLLRYYAQAFRTYCGNFRFHVFTPGDTVISAAVGVEMFPIGRYMNADGYSANESGLNGAAAFGKGVLDIQTPYVSRFPILKVPWFQGESFKETSSSGVLTVAIQEWPEGKSSGSLLVGAGDGFRFANMCRIPSLQVATEEYAWFPHYGGTPVDVPEFMKMVVVDGSGVDVGLSQSLVDSWVPIRALTLPATGIADLVEMVVPSVNVSDAMLRVFGFAIKEGQPRNVLTGVTSDYDIRVDGTGILSAVPWTFSISATPSSTVSNPNFLAEAVGSGTTYTFVDQWGINNKLATVWTIHDENRDNAKWRTLAGIPSGAVLVANNDSKTVSVPMTATYVTAGYTLKRWVNGPVALGFGAPTLVKSVEQKVPGKRKEEKEYFLVQQSGKVQIVGDAVQKTSGGLESKVNVLTMGEDVPSNIGLVMKEQLVETLSWGVGSVAGTPLTYYEAPFDLIKSVVMRSAFARYTYWRGDMTLRVQMQSNNFMNGSVLVTWMPLCNSSQTLSVNTGNLRSLSVSRHAIMYAGACSTVELSVPYVHNRTHLDLRVPTEDNVLGTFGIYVMNPLRAGPSATSTSVSLTVFASFTGSDFAVINPTGVSIVAQGGIQSKVTNINIEHAASATVDASSVGDAFTGGATSAPMDLPNVGLNYMPTNNRIYPVVCNTANIDYCQVLNMSAATRPLTKSVDTGTSQDEMEIGYLTQKMSYVSSFMVTTTNTMGEAVYVADLCPAFELFNMPYGSSFTPTLLSYVSFPFSYWKGSLVYKIVAVASPIHTARVQICSHVGYEAAGLSVDEAFGQYTCIFEVRGVSEITISFPWRSPTEWKKVNNGSNVDTTNYSMGQFSVRVLNPLQAMESVSAAIDFNVYYAGGSDFELAYIGNNAIDLSPVDALL